MLNGACSSDHLLYSYVVPIGIMIDCFIVKCYSLEFLVKISYLIILYHHACTRVQAVSCKSGYSLPSLSRMVTLDTFDGPILTLLSDGLVMVAL